MGDVEDLEELFTLLCRRLQEGPHILIRGQCATVKDVFRTAGEMIGLGRYCYCWMLRLLQVGRMAILARRKHGELEYAEDLTRLGIAAMEAICRVERGRRLTCSTEMDAITTAASCLSLWKPPMGNDFKPSFTLAAWAASLLCNLGGHVTMFAVRVEMLRLLAFLDASDFLHEWNIACYIIRGVFTVIQDMDAGMLLPTEKPGLLWVLRRLLWYIMMTNHLMTLVTTSCRQVKKLHVNPRTQKFATLALLMRDTAKRVEWLQECGHLTSSAALVHYSDIIQILHMLFAVPPVQELFELPGFSRIAAQTIITTCRRILSMEVAGKEKIKFEVLLKNVNEFFRDLWTFQRTGGLVAELKHYHDRGLPFFSFAMRRWPQLAHCILSAETEEDENPRDFPQHFMDDLTGQMMQEPLTVMPAGAVVDSSTVLYSILIGKRLTHEVSFKKMEDREKEIREWRESYKKGDSSMKITAEKTIERKACPRRPDQQE